MLFPCTYKATRTIRKDFKYKIFFICGPYMLLRHVLWLKILINKIKNNEKTYYQIFSNIPLQRPAND